MIRRFRFKIRRRWRKLRGTYTPPTPIEIPNVIDPDEPLAYACSACGAMYLHRARRLYVLEAAGAYGDDCDHEHVRGIPWPAARAIARVES